MSSDLPELFESALSLPDNQRADLAFQLLGSLKPPQTFSEEDPRFPAEIQRRLESYDSGNSEASSFDEVTARVRQALRDRKKP